MRNDFEQERGSFRVRGDVVEIIPAASNEKALRIELFGDEIERIAEVEIVSDHKALPCPCDDLSRLALRHLTGQAGKVH